MIVLLAVLGVLANAVSLWALPVLIIGGLLGLSVIGALQLRQGDALSERGFLGLMALTLRQLPLVKASGREAKQLDE